MMSALIDEVVSVTGLPVPQVEGAVGLALTKLQELLSEADFQMVRTTLPEADRLISLAPAVKKGFLNYIAGNRTGVLLELSQALRQLGIPTEKHKPLAKALGATVETQHPELVPLFEKIVT